MKSDDEVSFYINKNGRLYSEDFYVVGFNHFTTKQLFVVGVIL